MLEPKLPWDAILRDFVQRSAKNDYNWTRPNRRHFGRGIILPTLISDELPEIAVAIDTSASIRQEDLNDFAAEIATILATYRTTARIIYCDARIQGEEEFSSEDELKLELKGGGGTKFAPVFELIEQNGYDTCCLIYFTDLYGPFPQHEPEYPVLWVTPTKDREAPFGETVHYTRRI
jgi:predicted metal-dependent peptidase